MSFARNCHLAQLVGNSGCWKFWSLNPEVSFLSFLFISVRLSIRLNVRVRIVVRFRLALGTRLGYSRTQITPSNACTAPGKTLIAVTDCCTGIVPSFAVYSKKP